MAQFIDFLTLVGLCTICLPALDRERALACARLSLFHACFRLPSSGSTKLLEGIQSLYELLKLLAGVPRFPIDLIVALGVWMDDGSRFFGVESTGALAEADTLEMSMCLTECSILFKNCLSRFFIFPGYTLFLRLGFLEILDSFEFLEFLPIDRISCWSFKESRCVHCISSRAWPMRTTPVGLGFLALLFFTACI